MQLNQLLDHPQSLEIKGIVAHSQDVQPGFLFVAVPGMKSDGTDFIQDAIDRGAVAVLAAEDAKSKIKQQEGLVYLFVQNVHETLAKIAARFYGQRPATIVAVTGTNGKSSTVDFIRQIWHKLGCRAASIGTLGMVVENGPVESTSLTTPPALELHAQLQKLSERGITHVAMEASSHALDRHRLDGLMFQAAGFTNLTQDHLDYHPSMEHYFQSKMRLFTERLEAGATAVLNADIESYAALKKVCENRKTPILSYGYNGANLCLKKRSLHPHGQDVVVDVLGKSYEFYVPLIGEFQVMNVLCSLGLLLATGNSMEKILPYLSTLQTVNGRVDLAATLQNGASIYVDYAHTPDGLENVLKALKPHATHRLIVLFGCGGNRDKTKRPKMGAIAQEFADVVLVTDDNPRFEDPVLIRAEIMQGCPGAINISEGRAQAIAQAIGMMQAGDILVVAGKGHEEGQIINGQTYPFNDKIEVQKIIKKQGI